MQFVDILIRQAHPGELRGPYQNHDEMLEDARAYKRDEGIDWPVLADDYEGTVHRTYSREMADPSFLIDSEGCVAFYNMWTHAPSLKRAIDDLLEQGGRGAPVAGGIDQRPHLLASFVDGYRGISRGGKQGVREYITGGLGAGLLTILGSKAKPMLAPIALRAEPLPTSARLALGGGLLGVAALGIRLLRRGS